MSSGPGRRYEKPRAGIVDLRAGHAKVSQDRIDARDRLAIPERHPGSYQHTWQPREVVVKEIESGRVSVPASVVPRQCSRDQSRSDETALGTDAFQDCHGMAAQSNRAVHYRLAGSGRKHLEHLMEEHGNVRGCTLSQATAS
jgi:hypothetical protein